MRKFIVLVVALFMVSPLAWSFTSEAEPMPKPFPLTSPIERWQKMIDTKPVQTLQLDEVYNLQINYPDETIIDLANNNYLIQFNNESVQQYFNTEASSPARYLREVSAHVLGLMLYRLGGDGTDHDQQCNESLIRRLPAKRHFSDKDEWSATYSGLFVDFYGLCSEFGGSAAYYVFLQISFNPETQTGEIFVGGEDLTGKSGPTVDLFHAEMD